MDLCSSQRDKENLSLIFVEPLIEDMYLEQIYTKCLAEASYYIESNGEVAIIDPLRDPQPYLAKAKERGAKIKYIFETHFHADFVSGHQELAKLSGAQIIYGPNADTDYQVHSAVDGEVLELGELSFKVLHTPGHTLESTTYLLNDAKGKAHAIFTGDTLFIGDVGRPDLAINRNLEREDLAKMMYNSLRTQIMPLADDVLVYPAHGAGSACGKSMSKETFDTLGNQKKFNYALRSDMSESEFVSEVLDGLLPAPHYFAENAMLNKSGIGTLEEVFNKGVKALNATTFQKLSEDGKTLILDVRHQDDFAAAHIAGSVFIGLNGGFAPWVGTLITDINIPIALVVDAGKEKEAVERLARVGYDNTIGYLEGGVEAWKVAGFKTQSVEEVSAEELANALGEFGDSLNVLDVRKIGEYNTQRLEQAQHIPLSNISEKTSEIQGDEKVYVHCAGGYRSMIAISLANRIGNLQLVNVHGGMGKMNKTSMKLCGEVCTA